MAGDEQSKEMRHKLIERIEELFADTTRPGEAHLTRRSGEVAPDFVSLTWQEVPAESLRKSGLDLADLHPEAFRYYLPAILRTILAEGGLSELHHIVIELLAPSLDDMRKGSWMSEIWGGLADEQRNLLYRLYFFYDQLFPDSRWPGTNFEIEIYNRALMYWSYPWIDEEPSRQLRHKLAERVEEVFADTVRPDEIYLTRYSWDVGEDFVNLTWQEVDAELLNQHNSRLFELHSVAFCYYLPAMLRAILLDLDDDIANLHDDVLIYELVPDPYNEYRAKRLPEIAEGLTDEQRGVIYTIYTSYNKLFPRSGWFSHYEADRNEYFRALDYWAPKG